MRRTKALLSCLLALALVMLTASTGCPRTG